MYQLKKKKSCRYCCHLWSRPRNFQTTHVLYYTRNSDCKDERNSQHLSSPETLQNDVRSHGRRVCTCSTHQSGVFIEGVAGITPTRRWSSWKLRPVVYCLAIKITWNTSTTGIVAGADTDFVGACTTGLRLYGVASVRECWDRGVIYRSVMALSSHFGHSYS
jgi:hypothetical protein